jgi:hypothetical protein
VRSPQHTGLDAGRYVPFGHDADLPPDQREEDAKSACFDFEVTEEVRILGRPRVRLRLTCPVPRGQVVARLCDVAPDGASTLVTRGALNLSARQGADRVAAWTPGATEEVAFALTSIGHVFPVGHRIRLAVSSAYWPWIWPQPGSDAGFTLDPEGSRLELPVRQASAEADAVRRTGAEVDRGASGARGASAARGEPLGFEEPEQAEPLGVVSPVTLDDRRPERLVVRDVAGGEWRLEVRPRFGDTLDFPDGLEVTEDATDTYTIGDSDPLSARADSTWSIRFHRPDLPWNATVATRSTLTCDATHFHAANEVVCRDGDEVVFHRTWKKRIPRTAG